MKPSRNNNYRIPQAAMDFGADLLADGAEWYLTEKPNVKTNKGYEVLTFHEARCGRIREKADKESEKDLTLLQIRRWDNFSSSGMPDAELCIDEKWGETVRTWCNCEQFRGNRYACKHIAALAVYHLMDNGERLENTAIERKMQEKTGAPHPFEPGCLRHTSSSLAALLKKADTPVGYMDKPTWVTGEKKSAPARLNLEFYGSIYEEQLCLEMKGGTRKCFFIKSMDEFFDAYQNSKPYAFSNSNIFPAGRDAFSPETQKILDYLDRIRLAQKRKDLQEVDRGYYGPHSYGTRTAAQEAKSLLLTGHELDGFMELMNGKTIFFTDGQEKNIACTVDLAADPSPIHIEKTQYGAVMRMEKETILGCGFSHMYLRQNNKIYSLPASAWEGRKTLLEAFRSEKELYVQNRDLPAILSYLEQNMNPENDEEEEENQETEKEKQGIEKEEKQEAGSGEVQMVGGGEMQMPGSIEVQMPGNTEVQMAGSTEVQMPDSADPQLLSATDPQLPVTEEAQLPAWSEAQLPAATAPQLPAVADPQLPATTEPQLPATAGPQLPAATTPQHPAQRETQLPVVADSQLPAIAEPQLPATAGPQLPAATEPQLPVAAAPQLPVPDYAQTTVRRKARKSKALDLVGFELTDYQKETPQIRIYLDYPQENMITCKVKAFYSVQGKTYDLFDQKVDKEKRNIVFEQPVGESIWAYFDAWDEASGQLAADCNDDRLFKFLTETIPSLSKYGDVMISDRLKRLKVKSSVDINVGIQVDAGNLLMSLHSNQISKEEIIEVLSSYNRKQKFTRLKNGTFITNTEDNGAIWEALAETFRAYGKKNPEAMKVPMFRALYMEEMLQDRNDIQLEAGADYLELLRKLKDEESWNYEIPKSLEGTLRSYQKDGYRWLCMLKEHGFGGILADDMGLGKTLQILAFLLGEKERSAEKQADTEPETGLTVCGTSAESTGLTVCGTSAESTGLTGRGKSGRRKKAAGKTIPAERIEESTGLVVRPDAPLAVGGNPAEQVDRTGRVSAGAANTCLESANLASSGPTLIIAPASLVYNWQKEIRTFTPQLTCRVLAGNAKERKEILEALKQKQKAENGAENTRQTGTQNAAGNTRQTGTQNTAENTGAPVADIYITSYDLLKRDIGYYEGIHFANQIIDEAQYIKNQNTQSSKAVRLIDSSFRMAITGTPIENRLSELWSIFDYIMPGFLYGYSRFRDDYESPVINDHDQEVMDRLRHMVHPFILRRLKKEVLKDLPDKLEEPIAVVLEGEQRKVYDAYAERLRLYLDKQSDKEYHQNKLQILAELTTLRQICCGPELILNNFKGKNAKMEACIELLHQAIDSGHKVLLFSQFVKVLDELGKKLKQEKIDYYRIDGSTSKEERMRLVDAFQSENDSTPVFCISLKAGGTGLNLTAADIVIHYDPWWNLAAQNQATDRTHRIGQTNTVTVYSLIAEDTIEEQITTLQRTKAQLAEDILSGEGIASIMIHKEDLMALL